RPTPMRVEAEPVGLRARASAAPQVDDVAAAGDRGPSFERVLAGAGIARAPRAARGIRADARAAGDRARASRDVATRPEGGAMRRGRDAAGTVERRADAP